MPSCWGGDGPNVGKVGKGREGGGPAEQTRAKQLPPPVLHASCSFHPQHHHGCTKDAGTGKLTES